jgi:hypothetical protein
MRNRMLAVLFNLSVMLASLLGCGDDDVTEPSSAPSSHTISEDGVRHLEGLQEPIINCTGCHGSDLRGGDDGEPSCYSCHGPEWH